MHISSSLPRLQKTHIFHFSPFRFPVDVEVEVSLLHANYALLTSESETPMQTIYSLSVAVTKKEKEMMKIRKSQRRRVRSRRWEADL